MYSTTEIAFFLLYYEGLAIASITALLAIQFIVYRITGFSIYKHICKTLAKLSRMLENKLNKLLEA